MAGVLGVFALANLAQDFKVITMHAISIITFRSRIEQVHFFRAVQAFRVFHPNFVRAKELLQPPVHTAPCGCTTPSCQDGAFHIVNDFVNCQIQIFNTII